MVIKNKRNTLLLFIELMVFAMFSYSIVVSARTFPLTNEQVANIKERYYNLSVLGEKAYIAKINNTNIDKVTEQIELELKKTSTELDNLRKLLITSDLNQTERQKLIYIIILDEYYIQAFDKLLLFLRERKPDLYYERLSSYHTNSTLAFEALSYILD